MRTLNDLIKPGVRNLAAYTLTPHRTSIKLNQNENPFDMPDDVKREVLRRLEHRPWARYPDFVPVELQETLARFAAWRPDGVLVGNGSNELIQALLTIIVGKGTRVVLSEPTFTVYRLMVEVLDGEVVNVPPRADFHYDMAAIRATAIESNAAAVILCSPNNPTGKSVAAADLRRLLDTFDGLVLVDEAYHEFSGQSYVPLIAEYPKLVVLRTFSKAMAMAGLRVGYFLGAPDLAVELNKAKLPYNLNFFSMMAAQVAVERYDTALKPLVDKIVAERARVIDRLRDFDWLDPVPTDANFMIVRTPKLPPATFFEEMLKRDILVRAVNKYPMLGEYIRFNIGTPEENDAFLAALADIEARHIR